MSFSSVQNNHKLKMEKSNIIEINRNMVYIKLMSTILTLVVLLMIFYETYRVQNMILCINDRTCYIVCSFIFISIIIALYDLFLRNFKALFIRMIIHSVILSLFQLFILMSFYNWSNDYYKKCCSTNS
ncbi:hypothetical protein EDEG_00652 [Edhazardia aedis USNM 41457]|uniref:Uncharacterized protein n=1 Tax=Edhazardia aedis (strain USNM 41457) TaxID=1003232 RepID=J9DCV0_EDHAE|nr:hypothetical protein EDEG_00652 [Edhazardia aedis USNM 41457]|eukprot:EJW05294.1 hypothetical protein EDEG_00652 [Edhazardia aedis USNM 41457]